MLQEQDDKSPGPVQNKRSVTMKGLSKEVKSAIIIGIVIVLLLILGIIYGQREKTEVADAPTTTVSEVAETTVLRPPLLPMSLFRPVLPSRRMPTATGLS